MASNARERWVLLFMAVAVAISGGILSRVPNMYVSPDETANAYFARQLATTGTPAGYEPLNPDLEDAIHPRSMISVQGRLLPVGFLGIPVFYGYAVRALGDWVLLYLTPVLALLAVFAWYDTLRRVTDRTLARVSTVLLATLPAWWYYQARALMPNVPFVALLIVAVWVWVARPCHYAVQRLRRMSFASRLSHQWIARAGAMDPLVAGMVAGAAIGIRSSELVWLVPASIVTYVVARPVLSWRRIALAATGVCLGVFPILAWNQLLYGSPVANGYTIETTMPLVPRADVSVASLGLPVDASLPLWMQRAWVTFETWLLPVFPFGIHPRIMLRHVTQYMVLWSGWLTALAVLGIVFVTRRRGWSSERVLLHRAYGAFALTAALILIVLYGSWVVYDNPDPKAISIANSYVRYWLPIFVLAVPYAATALIALSARAHTSRAKQMSLIVLTTAVVLLNTAAVFWASHDGLANVSRTLARSVEIREAVLEMTPTDAIIVVDRADKLFFPYRRVVYPLRDDHTYTLLPRMLNRASVYYYGITLPPQDVEYLNTHTLQPGRLMIQHIQTFDEESLYQFIPVQ